MPENFDNTRELLKAIREKFPQSVPENIGATMNGAI